MSIPQKELLKSEMDQLKKFIYHREKLDNLKSEIIQVQEAIKTANETEHQYDLLLIDEEEKLKDLIATKSKSMNL